MIVRCNGIRGQALVEFAIATSIFLTLMFAMVDFGRALFAYDGVAQAARVGTRYAIVDTPKPPSDCSVSGGTCQTTILNAIVSKTGIDQTKVTPTITFGGTLPTCATQPTVGCYVNIRLAYQFNFLALPLAATNLSSTSQMVISSQ